LSGFELHSRLAADTFPVADWNLSRVLLMNDARYPWIILVPRRAVAVEFFDLNEVDRKAAIEEIALASQRLKTITSAAKINIGALGNLVPQLHVHIVARTPSDAAWPGPVWGQGASIPYAPGAQAQLIASFVNAP
jgi:diadenosine tetraphosphate (Ap4A) HIT family hydrolase